MVNETKVVTLGGSESRGYNSMLGAFAYGTTKILSVQGSFTFVPGV